MRSQTDLANRSGYETSFTNEYSANQNAAIITPASGKSIQVKGVYLGSAASSGKVRLYFGTSGNTIATIYAADNTGYIPVFLEGARNEAIKCEATTGDNNYFVAVNYTEK